MDTLIINVENDGNIASYEARFDQTVQEFFESLPDHENKTLFFEEEDFLKKYKDDQIRDTELYNLSTMQLVNIDPRTVILGEDEEILFESEKYLIYFCSDSSVFNLKHSITLFCECILPFQLIEERYFQKCTIVPKQYDRPGRINNKKVCVYQLQKFRDIGKEIEQIPSDLFIHDLTLEKKIVTDEFFDDKTSDLIIDLLISTGSVMAGSYVLSQLVDEIEPGDVDIFSYSLDFLRLFLEYILDDKIYFNVKHCRQGRLDSYKVKLGKEDPKCLNFVHLGDVVPEDLILDRETNRDKTIQFILEDFDILACASCYDGKRVLTNQATLEKRSYYRLTCNQRYSKYLERGIRLIPIPGIKTVKMTERHGYNGNTDVFKTFKTIRLNFKYRDEEFRIDYSRQETLSDLYAEYEDNGRDVKIIYNDKVVPNINLKLSNTSIMMVQVS